MSKTPKLEDRIQAHRNFHARVSRRFPDGLCRSAGQVGAKVAVVGMKPERNETIPFTGKLTGLAGQLLASLEVPDPLLLKTYLVRSPRAARSPAVPWVEILKEELEIVRPKAVILLGAELARAVLNLPGEEIEHLRKTRFVFRKNAAMSWFVTFSPQDVDAGGGLQSPMGNYWTFDHSAVFESVERYFATRILES